MSLPVCIFEKILENRENSKKIIGAKLVLDGFVYFKIERIKRQVAESRHEHALSQEACNAEIVKYNVKRTAEEIWSSLLLKYFALN